MLGLGRWPTHRRARTLVIASCVPLASPEWVHWPYGEGHDTGVSGRGVSAAGDGAVRLTGDARAYLMNRHGYERLDLRGRTVRVTLDVSRVPCSSAATFYFTEMTRDQYCDVQSWPGWCTEIDVFEANTHAIQATVHTQRGEGGDRTCNQWGCGVNWGRYGHTRPAAQGGLSTAALYGPGASIDTRRPFMVTASFGNEGQMSVTLSQDGRSLPFFNRTSASNPSTGDCGGACGIRDPPGAMPTGLDAASEPVTKGANERGLVLVLSQWGDDDMRRWLDYECPDDQRARVWHAVATYADCR